MNRRCDHDPDLPRLALPIPVAPNLPRINADAIARSEKLYTHPQLFPELTLSTIAGDCRVRQRRSSRREAWARYSKALHRRVDNRTHRVGTERDDGLCTGLDLDKLEADTGLSRSRLNRVIREFEEAGYTVSKQPVEALFDDAGRPVMNEDGTQKHRGFPSVRWLTPLFYQRMGFTKEKVARAVERSASKWRARRARPLSPGALAELRRIRRGMKAGSSRRRPAPAGLDDGAHLRALQLEVLEKHPEWSLERQRAEVDRLKR